jgi:seryl-tRNA synthetase
MPSELYTEYLKTLYESEDLRNKIKALYKRKSLIQKEVTDSKDPKMSEIEKITEEEKNVGLKLRAIESVLKDKENQVMDQMQAIRNEDWIMAHTFLGDEHEFKFRINTYGERFLFVNKK